MDATLPIIFNENYQIHDGLLDITNASDRVTVSYNRFLDHDKTMLIGSSDNAPADVGRLRVTLHHNLFENIGQRAPRVRYGQLHVYNNYYVIPDPDAHGYSWGVGVQPLPVTSGIFAENNFFRTEKSVTPDQFIARFTNGRAIHAQGTLHDAASANHRGGSARRVQRGARSGPARRRGLGAVRAPGHRPDAPGAVADPLGSRAAELVSLATPVHGADGGSVKFTVAVMMTGVGAPFSSVGS